MLDVYWKSLLLSDIMDTTYKLKYFFHPGTLAYLPFAAQEEEAFAQKGNHAVPTLAVA